FDHPWLRQHAVAPALPFELEFAGVGFAADEGEAQEVEGLRFAEPAPLAAFRRKASELDDPGLLRMKRQRKLPQPLTHLIQEASGVNFVLESDDEWSGGRDSHPSALTDPEVKLAPHPAPPLQPPVARRAATGRTDWGPVARCFPASASMLVPGV